MTRAITLGAAVVLAVAVPVAVVGSLALDDGSNLVFPLAAVVVAAFVAGGWFAGRQLASGSPLVAGAAAAATGFAVAQAVAVALLIARDEDVRPAVIAANAALAAAGGLVGGAVAAR